MFHNPPNTGGEVMETTQMKLWPHLQVPSFQIYASALPLSDLLCSEEGSGVLAQRAESLVEGKRFTQ